MDQQTFDDYLLTPPAFRMSDEELRARGWFVGESEGLDAWLAERAKGRKK